MPLTVELRSESGKVLALAGEHGTNPDGYLPNFTDDDFPTLRFIDPYGNTVFNELQMEVVIPELQRLKERAGSDVQVRMIESIIELAERCRDGVHLYLWWVGD